MTQEQIKKIIEKLDEIKPALIRLQWDKEHDQLNPGKLPYLNSLEKEYNELVSQLKSMDTANEEEQDGKLSEDIKMEE